MERGENSKMSFWNDCNCNILHCSPWQYYFSFMQISETYEEADFSQVKIEDMDGRLKPLLTHIIIDCSMIGYADYVGVNTLAQVSTVGVIMLIRMT